MIDNSKTANHYDLLFFLTYLAIVAVTDLVTLSLFMLVSKRFPHVLYVLRGKVALILSIKKTSQ